MTRRGGGDQRVPEHSALLPLRRHPVDAEDVGLDRVPERRAGAAAEHARLCQRSRRELGPQRVFEGDALEDGTEEVTPRVPRREPHPGAARVRARREHAPLDVRIPEQPARTGLRAFGQRVQLLVRVAALGGPAQQLVAEPPKREPAPVHEREGDVHLRQHRVRREQRPRLEVGRELGHAHGEDGGRPGRVERLTGLDHARAERRRRLVARSGGNGRPLRQARSLRRLRRDLAHDVERVDDPRQYARIHAERLEELVRPSGRRGVREV